MTSKYAFAGAGEGVTIGAGVKDGFGRRALSKKAREERAAAAERRLRALQAGKLLSVLSSINGHAFMHV